MENGHNNFKILVKIHSRTRQIKWSSDSNGTNLLHNLPLNSSDQRAVFRPTVVKWFKILFISQESRAFARGVRRANGRGRGEMKQRLLRFVLVWIGLWSWRSSATHLRPWQQCSGRHRIVCGLSFLVLLLTRWSLSQLACFYSLPFYPPGVVAFPCSSSTSVSTRRSFSFRLPY